MSLPRSLGQRRLITAPMTSAAEATSMANAVNSLHPQKSPTPVVVEFGSAENNIAAKVAADIEECERINGAEDFFGSTESRIREKIKPAYKSFRRANADPAYCAELVKQLNTESGRTYTPSSTKPWCLAAFLALKPKTEAHEKQTYDAAYFFRHAGIEDVSLDGFAMWIENRNLKESIAFVRGRKRKGESKPSPYPNIAKAKKLKNHEASAKILKDAYDMAEDELKKLFNCEAAENNPND